PFEQGRGGPRLLFQGRVAGRGRPLPAHRVQFPEDAAPAPVRQIPEVVQRDVDETTRHRVGTPCCDPRPPDLRPRAGPGRGLPGRNAIRGSSRQHSGILGHRIGQGSSHPTDAPGAILRRGPRGGGPRRIVTGDAVACWQASPSRRYLVEKHSRTDAYTDRYAARAAGMVPSEIRALFAVASRPEVVSLAGGRPYVSALPLDAVGDMIGALVAGKGAHVLQYGSAQGDERLREHICEVMSLEGIQASADDVVVTVGAQQALDLITKIFVDPGDVVLAEAPSYVGALGTFASYQADVVHVPLDEGGLIP